MISIEDLVAIARARLDDVEVLLDKERADGAELLVRIRRRAGSEGKYLPDSQLAGISRIQERVSRFCELQDA
ncbi:MAG: hypothetical protein ACXW31_05795 [Thermoanaerobaculia bacterium]